METCANCTKNFVKFGMNAHFASYRYLTSSWEAVVKDGHLFHFCMLSHLAIHIHKSQSSTVLKYVVCYFDLVCIEYSGLSVVLRHRCSEDVFKFDFGIERTTASSN